MVNDFQKKAAYLSAMDIDIWQSRQATEQNVAPAETTELAISQLSWETLEEKVKNCVLCPLHKTRTQTVFGVGNRQAKLLLIGEAPGANEDKQGEPFVGRAGQLLNSILASIQLKREDIFIANILKCRPPNNRDPQPEEVNCCTPYLSRQIALIEPTLIVTLGRIAAQFLLDTKISLSKLRQQTHQYENIPLIVTYHPAYLLRSPTEKAKAWEDWSLIKEKSNV